MSNIINTVRATVIALVVASPALAQTPRDVANLLSQQNVAYTASSPSNPTFAGAGSATDVAALVQDSAVSISVAPNGNVFASAFTAQDLARLSSVATQAGQPTVTVAENAR